MEVKYTTPENKTREGVLLWGLEDGEMVLNTETWERSHGFYDALASNANRNDFKIINALIKENGYLSREDLLNQLHVEPETANEWIASARDKHLIVQQNSGYQLHFEDPKLPNLPQTKVNHWLVTKPYSHASRVSQKFSKSQIEKLAMAAFGLDLTIRSEKEIFLPVYNIEILNPDGSILTTYWNALNGKRINPKYFMQ
jgi:hypothetical protein